MKEIGSKTPLILKQNPKLTTPRPTPGSYRVTEKVQPVLPMNRQVRGPPVDLSKTKQVHSLEMIMLFRELQIKLSCFDVTVIMTSLLLSG